MAEARLGAVRERIDPGRREQLAAPLLVLVAGVLRLTPPVALEHQPVHADGAGDDREQEQGRRRRESGRRDREHRAHEQDAGRAERDRRAAAS